MIAFGWSVQNSNVAEPLVEVGRPSGPSGPSGPDRIDVSGAIPDEARAIAKSEKPSTMLLHRRAGVENGLWSVVTSSHSSPSKWSRRTGRAAAEVRRVVVDADRDRLGVLPRSSRCRRSVRRRRRSPRAATGRRRAGRRWSCPRCSTEKYVTVTSPRVTVTLSPTGVFGGPVGVPIVHSCVAGLGSTLPDGSVATARERVVARDQVGELGHDARLAVGLLRCRSGRSGCTRSSPSGRPS